MHQQKNSIAISNYEYDIFYKENLTKWYVYDTLYYSQNVEKKFCHLFIDKKLEKRKIECWEKEERFKKFRQDIKEGKIKLKE